MKRDEGNVGWEFNRIPPHVLLTRIKHALIFPSRVRSERSRDVFVERHGTHFKVSAEYNITFGVDQMSEKRAHASGTSGYRVGQMCEGPGCIYMHYILLKYVCQRVNGRNISTKLN